MSNIYFPGSEALDPELRALIAEERKLGYRLGHDPVVLHYIGSPEQEDRLHTDLMRLYAEEARLERADASQTTGVRLADFFDPNT